MVFVCIFMKGADGVFGWFDRFLAKPVHLMFSYRVSMSNWRLVLGSSFGSTEKKPVTIMKIVLQNLETLSYAHSYGDWTPHLEAAIGFSGVIGALDYAIKHRFLHVRVVMTFPNSADDLDFPPVHWAFDVNAAT